MSLPLQVHEDAPQQIISQEHEQDTEMKDSHPVEIVEEGDNDDDDDDDDDEQPHMVLPLSKIKKIFKMDPDYGGSLQSAVYATGLATELFIQYFVEQASLLAKTEKRKKIVYKDFSNAVASHDTLSFLSDTVPKTQPIGELVLQKKVILNTDKQLLQHHPQDRDENLIIEENDQDVELVDDTDDLKPQKKTPKKKANTLTSLAKGQLTLTFAKPPRKAQIGDLVTSTEDVVMID